MDDLNAIIDRAQAYETSGAGARNDTLTMNIDVLGSPDIRPRTSASTYYRRTGSHHRMGIIEGG
jgi:hypothetical protein